ncbi:hypothetical protein B0T17DRAFT_511336 [Bombardia bombarda]|uniref:Secreted protein n=1 Tax=Bombardia bombarda TaxID=252184 RepID=A0AA39U7T1_9PEZI|nr:hypothetical protein B0T17DRAFT_511336 [Bombardia bombarda]
MGEGGGCLLKMCTVCPLCLLWWLVDCANGVDCATRVFWSRRLREGKPLECLVVLLNKEAWWPSPVPEAANREAARLPLPWGPLSHLGVAARDRTIPRQPTSQEAERRQGGVHFSPCCRLTSSSPIFQWLQDIIIIDILGGSMAITAARDFRVLERAKRHGQAKRQS